MLPVKSAKVTHRELIHPTIDVLDSNTSLNVGRKTPRHFAIPSRNMRVEWAARRTNHPHPPSGAWPDVIYSRLDDATVGLHRGFRGVPMAA